MNLIQFTSFNKRFVQGSIFFAAAVLTIASCKEDPEPEFDRKAMLTDMASLVIKPQLNDLAVEVEELDQAASVFASSSTLTNLTVVQNEFVDAYISWQHCKMFDFGPMMDYAVKSAMNTYPTDTAKIQSNIESGSYVLGSAGNIDAIGLPALDFLLFANGNASVIDNFTSDLYAANRKAYMTDITAKMKSELNLVIDGWVDYESTFISADGNDAGSSTSLVFNEMVKDIELIKNAKVGIPAGQLSGGQTLPTYVEGYYGQLSIELAKENLNGLKALFTGGSGIGFDDYIKDVESDETSTSLADNIINQMDFCKTKLDAIGTPLSSKVDTNPSAVNTAYLELKKLVTYCKTDMSSTLGLLITFQDNDGD